MRAEKHQPTRSSHANILGLLRPRKDQPAALLLMSTSLLILLATAYAISQATAPGRPVPRFQDVAKEVGLTVPHISSPEKKYIVESMSGGVGLIDCDNDGKLDIITVNGSTIERFRQGGDPLITLYHQDPGFKFSDITQAVGLTRKGWGMGVAVADYDHDGCVDLYVSRYVHFDMNHLPTFGSDEKNCRFKGILVQCGPWGMVGESDFLFHNPGDGTFEDVTKKAGVEDTNRYYGLGVIWGDYDSDGWPDLYVANDAGPNYLYHNKHDGTFEDVSLLSGAALSLDGREQGSMGVDFADYDHDGKLDLLVTNFTQEPDTLYWNREPQGFDDISGPTKLAQPTFL